MSLDYLILGAS